MSEDLIEAYALPDPDDHPGVIAAELLKLPEHQHLRDGDACIEFLFRRYPKVRHGREVLGTACMPVVQGELSDCFEWMLIKLLGTLPDFLIILDQAFWREATPHVREIMVYHELKHCAQKVDQYGSARFHRDGSPMWGIRGHDVEEFSDTVRRYGAWTHDIAIFVAAVNGHGR